MIKKIINGAAVLIIVLTTVLWIYTDKKDVPSDLKVYAIKSNYMYLESTEKISFCLYLNSKNNIIQYKDDNSFSLCDNEENTIINLVIYSVIKGDHQTYENEKIYPYIFNFENNNFDANIFFNKAFLLISNANYRLKIEIGSFEYVKKKNNELNIDFNKLYGVYNEINGVNNLVGIVITLVNKDAVEKNLKVYSSTVLGLNLDKVISGQLVENETDINNLVDNYNINEGENLGTLSLGANEEKTVFIPITYRRFYYTDNIFLEISANNNNFYIDNFVLQSNTLLLSHYTSLLVRGALL